MIFKTNVWESVTNTYNIKQYDPHIWEPTNGTTNNTNTISINRKKIKTNRKLQKMLEHFLINLTNTASKKKRRNMVFYWYGYTFQTIMGFSADRITYFSENILQFLRSKYCVFRQKSSKTPDFFSRFWSSGMKNLKNIYVTCGLQTPILHDSYPMTPTKSTKIDLEFRLTTF